MSRRGKGLRRGPAGAGSRGQARGATATLGDRTVRRVFPVLPRPRLTGSPSFRPRTPKVRLMARSTAPERRDIPHVGDLRTVNHKQVRNDFAQRIYAVPQAVRDYRPSPNPGKTGASLSGASQYHPGVMVYGDPEGGPIPAMPYNPDGTPPVVQ